MTKDDASSSEQLVLSHLEHAYVLVLTLKSLQYVSCFRTLNFEHPLVLLYFTFKIKDPHTHSRYQQPPGVEGNTKNFMSRIFLKHQQSLE